MQRFFGILILSVISLSLLGCTPSAAPTSPAATPAVTPHSACVGKAITFGDISENPDTIKSATQPFADYMAERLSTYGIECGNILVPDDLGDMIKLIKDGQVDVYMDSLYPATLVSLETGARPILRRWRNCDDTYYSVIFTTPNSGITNIEDLPGHMIAMDWTYSTSGFALPAIYLLDSGLNLVIKDAPTDKVAADEVGIFFSYGDPNTLNLVREGKVSAGATDDYYFLKKWQEEAPGSLIELAQTEPILRQAVLLQPDLPVDVQDAIKNELLQIHNDPAGLEVLKGAADTCKFDDPGGMQALFDQMQAMHNRLKEIPGWNGDYTLDQ